jgi:crotonobetainyl-CoA:carnitine CoA-transferase CaiB-like acyl-CoA transferase
MLPVENNVPNIFPVKLSAAPPGVRRPPRLLAGHADAVLDERGVDAENARRCARNGAFAP